MDYDCTALVTLLSLLLYWTFGALVGRARRKYNVSAPMTTGNADFERVFRVQQNTTESLIMQVPALWVFAIYISDYWAAGIGAAWILGRILYARGYYVEANKRGIGFMVSLAATTILLVGSLIGVGVSLYHGGS